MGTIERAAKLLSPRQNIDESDRRPLHTAENAFGLARKQGVTNQGWNRDNQTELGGDQGFGNTGRK